jgi:quinol-cytochrome oxidoreductase complex cytochrome b subunit
MTDMRQGWRSREMIAFGAAVMVIVVAVVALTLGAVFGPRENTGYWYTVAGLLLAVVGMGIPLLVYLYRRDQRRDRVRQFGYSTSRSPAIRQIEVMLNVN